MTGDEKTYVFNREKLAQPIEMKLYQKQNFFWIFFAFLKSILNFKYLPKKGDPDTDVFSEIPAPKKMVR